MTNDQNPRPDEALTPFERGARIAEQRTGRPGLRVNNRTRRPGDLAPRSPRQEKKEGGE